MPNTTASSQLESRRKQIASSLSKLLKKRGLELAQCGRDKTPDDLPEIETATGFWKSQDAGKPYRWIIHIEKNTPKKTTPAGTLAKLPKQPTAKIVGQFNLRRDNIGGILIRVIPAVRTASATFEVCHDWEWLLFFGFSDPLPSGTSSENFEFNPATGRLTWKGQGYRYAGAALFELASTPSNLKLGANPPVDISYLEASTALRKLLQVDLPEPTAPEATPNA